MNKKEKLGSILAGAGKAAKGALNSAVQAVDQNADGKFDLKDVSVIADHMGTAVKKGAQAVKETADEKARQLELKTLQPIFLDTLSDADFLMPKFIWVSDRDKKYVKSEVCRGSIGARLEQKGIQCVNIFRDSLDSFGLTFYPDSNPGFYYMDPSDRDHYIALDEYFSYLKFVRVNELQRIAQDLGAKHFKVTYKEEKTAVVEKKVKAHVKAVAEADVTHGETEKQYSMSEIAAEMSFPGHAPVKPELKYLQRDPSIQTLVSMRMNESSPLLHQKFMLKMSNSSGIKESDAAKIDAFLKEMRVKGKATVEREAQNESRRYLEYDIEF